MPGTLHLVATPIGNLEDITLRAVRVLGEVQLVAAEDTRRTTNLLRHLGLSTPTTSLHEHNEHGKAPRLVERLLAGDAIALVSDAGTPLVSDPGLRLVGLAREAGVAVVAVPGPSAVVAALVTSGAPTTTFLFLGFPPRKIGARRRWCEALATTRHTVVFFEAPHRLVATLRLMQGSIGDRQIALCRELTKIHEELVVRPISEILSSASTPRGEYTCVLWPAREDSYPPPPRRPSATRLARELATLAGERGSRRAALREMAVKYGLTQRELYAEVEKGKT